MNQGMCRVMFLILFVGNEGEWGAGVHVAQGKEPGRQVGMPRFSDLPLLSCKLSLYQSSPQIEGHHQPAESDAVHEGKP